MKSFIPHACVHITYNSLALSYPLSEFPLLTFLQSGQVVDSCVLEDGKEDEDEADPQVDVHSFDVGHSRHGGIHTCDDGGHGEHRSDS